jgi:hypothetical protein
VALIVRLARPWPGSRRTDKGSLQCARQRLVVAIALAMTVSKSVEAEIASSQLADDIFVGSRRVRIIGSRGQAMRPGYTKAASLCGAVDYPHLEILQQELQAGSEFEVANASIRVGFSQAGGGERPECDRSADSQYVEEASTKLAKSGRQPPAPAPPGKLRSAAARSSGSLPWFGPASKSNESRSPARRMSRKETRQCLVGSPLTRGDPIQRQGRR